MLILFSVKLAPKLYITQPKLLFAFVSSKLAKLITADLFVVEIILPSLSASIMTLPEPIIFTDLVISSPSSK